MTPEQLSIGGTCVTIHGANATIEGKIKAVQLHADAANLKLYKHANGESGAHVEVTAQHYRDAATPKEGDFVSAYGMYNFSKVETGVGGRVAILWDETPPVVE